MSESEAIQWAIYALEHTIRDRLDAVEKKEAAEAIEVLRKIKDKLEAS